MEREHGLKLNFDCMTVVWNFGIYSVVLCFSFVIF